MNIWWKEVRWLLIFSLICSLFIYKKWIFLVSYWRIFSFCISPLIRSDLGYWFFSPELYFRPHYNVVMKKVEVGGNVLELATDTFASGDQKGTIIDSGTTLAYLPESVYESVMNKVPNIAHIPPVWCLFVTACRTWTEFICSDDLDYGSATWVEIAYCWGAVYVL